MGTFIKAELGKIKNKKSCYIIPAIIGIIGLVIAGFFAKGVINAELILNNVSIVNILGCFILVSVLYVVSEDFSYETLRNYYILNYNVKDVLLWKVVVQLINAMLLFIFFVILFAISIFLISSNDVSVKKILVDVIIKLLISAPGYMFIILLLDMIFLKIRSVIVTILIYYYGFIQIFFILMITGSSCENRVIRILFLPIQLGYMFGNELSPDMVICSFVSELLYIIGFGMLYKLEVNKLVDKELRG